MQPTVLVLGASGATGRLVVKQLLAAGSSVRALVREPGTCQILFGAQAGLSECVGAISELQQEQLLPLLENCSAVVSCLGHRLSFTGIYGAPRNLVSDAVRVVCESLSAVPQQAKVKFILMNSSGCANPDADESPPRSQRIAVGLIRLLIPPHKDNEQAVHYLRTQISGAHLSIDWVAVRPDTLVDAEQVSPYQVVASPLRNVIFDAGHSSRINVAHFMQQLLSDDSLWARWRLQAPVIYNQAAAEDAE